MTGFKGNECYQLVDRRGGATASPQSILRDCGQPLVNAFKRLNPPQRKLVLYRCVVNKLNLLKAGKQLDTVALRRKINERIDGVTFTEANAAVYNSRAGEKLVACFDILCPGLLNSINFN